MVFLKVMKVIGVLRNFVSYVIDCVINARGEGGTGDGWCKFLLPFGRRGKEGQRAHSINTPLWPFVISKDINITVLS